MAIKRSSDKAFPEEDPEFQVAPMIDILLVLMTFFMSITSTEVLKTKTKLDLQLPVAKDSKPSDTAQNQIIINVVWNSVEKKGVIELEEKTMENPSDLVGIIARRRERLPYFRAVIRGGDIVPYSFVQQVLAACAEAEVDNITFSVLSQDGAKTYKEAADRAAPK